MRLRQLPAEIWLIVWEEVVRGECGRAMIRRFEREGGEARKLRAVGEGSSRGHARGRGTFRPLRHAQ